MITYILHAVYGFLMAYFGLIAPGMLNMTALKISLENGKKQAVQFALGAALIVFIQASIALLFADYFVQNPSVIEKLKVAGVIVFFSLSILFLVQAQKKVTSKKLNPKKAFFIRGLLMSSINMLAIPFYLGLSIFLGAKGKIIFNQPYVSLFALGATLGMFTLLFTYVSLAKLIIKKIAFIAKNINYVLSILFLTLGVVTLVKIINN